jgi:hypothetical protein
MLLPPGLPLAQKSDQFAAVDQKRSAIVDGFETYLDPLPYGLGVNGEELGNLAEREAEIAPDQPHIIGPLLPPRARHAWRRSHRPLSTATAQRLCTAIHPLTSLRSQ